MAWAMNGVVDHPWSVAEGGAAMTPEVARTVRSADLTGWKTVEVEYGDQTVPVRVPGSCQVLEMG
jgi:hypothetical protein